MSTVLTTNATIKCSHVGAVQLGPGASRLTVGGKPVLLAADVSGMPVSGCTNTNSAAGQKPCTSVSQLTAGAATKLKVAGTPVRLDTTNGITDSAPPGTLQVTEQQAKLTAI